MNTPIEKIEVQSSDQEFDADRVIVEVDGEEADAKKSAPPALVDINTEPLRAVIILTSLSAFSLIAPLPVFCSGPPTWRGH